MNPKPTGPLLREGLDWQGHRGCRGLMPENTIPAFLHALDLGVTTLELDLAVSRDSQLVVSHEPWMSHGVCTAPNGERVGEDREGHLRIYGMDYREIADYDCGSLPHARFPKQRKMKVSKPLFSEMVAASQRHIEQRALPQAYYNIEIKSKPEWDGTFTPNPQAFVELLMGALEDTGVPLRYFCIQSFDVRPLGILHRLHPRMTLAYLNEHPPADPDHIAADLGFNPAIYSPHHQFLNAELIAKAHEQGMKVIPWTVNDPARARALKAWGVDGIITDYPDMM